MFRALFKSITILVLLFVNVALFTWCVNQFLDKTLPKKTLISPVQAKTAPYAPKLLSPRISVAQPFESNLKNTTPSRQDKQGLVLQFQSLRTHINEAERTMLTDKLQLLKISSFHSAKIFIGAAFAGNNIPSPQIAKLRAQNVARFIYPYTQTVKMFYHPSMQEGVVIVEFIEPSPNK